MLGPNPVVGKDYDADKLSILDVLATDNHGRIFDIGVPTTLPAGLPEWLTYYATALPTRSSLKP